MAGKMFMRCGGIAVIVAACIALPALADPSLQNGDFSAGLSAWTLEYGAVTDGGGFALFEEDSASLSSTLSQQLTIPALAMQLSFDVLFSSAGAYDFSTWPDAFTACLYDNPLDLNPLISNPGYNDFFYMDHTGVVETVESFDGTRVTLDVSAFRGMDAYLVFDLLASDDGMTTSVTLDNVTISTVPAPGALLLGLVGMSAVGGVWRRFVKAV